MVGLFTNLTFLSILHFSNSTVQHTLTMHFHTHLHLDNKINSYSDNIKTNRNLIMKRNFQLRFELVTIEVLTLSVQFHSNSNFSRFQAENNITNLFVGISYALCLRLCLLYSYELQMQFPANRFLQVRGRTVQPCAMSFVSTAHCGFYERLFVRPRDTFSVPFL